MEISGQDTAAELAALKATAKAQDAKIKALSAQLRGDTSGAKRARSGAPVDKKPISVCTVCGKRGHNAADCWDKLDADQAKLDVAKANRDKKKADMAKRQSSSKDSTCHASLHGCVFDQQFVPHTPARKSTSLKEPLDPAPAFNSPVSQALQSRPRERMPCFQ